MTVKPIEPIEPIENTHLSPLIDPLLCALSTEKLALLARTCKLFNAGFKQELNARKLNELVRRIVCGEEKAINAILDINPELLRMDSGTAIDYSGKQIKNLTPFEAALVAGDTNMLNRMICYFDRLEKSREIMEGQFKQIFPEKKGESRIFPNAEGGLAGHFQRQKEAVFDFSELVNAISQANDHELRAALSKEGASFTETIAAQGKPYDQLTLTEKLNRFRKQFAKKNLDEILFNPQHLLKVFELYDAKFDTWNWNQRDLFWRQVIGFVQRFLPACDAQAFAQGIYYLTEENEELRRSFDFRYGSGSFYPVAFNSCSNLGFDYAAGRGGGVRGVCGRAGRLQNLYRAKTQSLENLCRSACSSRPIA